MTAKSVQQYEAAARRYCEMIGANPEEPSQIPGDIHNTMTMVYRTEPLWQSVARQMQQMSLLLKCMGET